jgi:hypothetical protein
MLFFYVFTYKMNRRNSSKALREAKSISRELEAILKNYVQVPVGQGRLLRSQRVLDLPAATLAAQAAARARFAEEQKGPPEEQKGPPEGKYDDEDEQRDEFEAANREDPMQEVFQYAEREYDDILSRYERMLQLRQRTARYRGVNLGQQTINALEKWNQDYLGRGVPQVVIDGIIARNTWDRFPLLAQELHQLREEQRDPVERAEADYHRILQKYEDEAKRSGLPNIINRATEEVKEWERVNLERDIPLDRLQDIVDRALNQMADRYPNIVRADEYQAREEEENKESAELQRKRDRWAELEEQGETIPRNTWLSGGVRVLRDIGLEPPAAWADLRIVAREMPAISFADRFWVKPQIKDWRRCQQCAFVFEDGEQCKRYASCHRDNPSNTYCWEHARKSGLTYQRRRGLV